MTQTVLWTNPSPTSNFENDTITLNQNYTNFDYIGVEYKRRAADTDTFIEMRPTSDLQFSYAGTSISTGSPNMVLFFRYVPSGGTTNVRFRYASFNQDDYTKCYFSNLFYGATGGTLSSTGTASAYIVPVKVIGYR